MLGGDLDGLIRLADQTTAQTTAPPPWLRLQRLRALVETGQIDQAITDYRNGQAHGFTMTDHALLRLVFFASTGKTAAVDSLLNGQLVNLHPTEKALWRLRSQIVTTPDSGPLLAALQALKPQAPSIIGRAIDREITRFPRILPAPSAQNQIILNDWQQQAETMRDDQRPWLSYGLIAINSVIFLLTTTLAGDVDLDRALSFGIAVYPEMAKTGQWWRLLTANFLHANWLHLLMNMLAIVWIGFDIERRIGVWRYTVIYFAAGLGTMAVGIVVHDLRHETEPFMALGASGAIFGLLGAFAMLSWHRWRHHHAEKGKQALRSIGLLLLIQSVFDFIYLQGSSTLHLARFVTGAVIGLIVLPASFRRQLFTDH